MKRIFLYFVSLFLVFPFMLTNSFAQTTLKHKTVGNLKSKETVNHLKKYEEKKDEREEEREDLRKRSSSMGGAPNVGAGMGTGTGAGSRVGNPTGRGTITSGAMGGEGVPQKKVPASKLYEDQ